MNTAEAATAGPNWTDWATTSVPPLATDGQFVYEVRAANGVGRAGDVASYVVWRDAGIVVVSDKSLTGDVVEVMKYGDDISERGR